MNQTITLPFTEVRNNLTELIQKANKYLTHLTITLRGRPKAVLMSKDEYDSIMETIEITSDKKLLKSIQQGNKDFEKGKTVAWEELKKELNV